MATEKLLSDYIFPVGSIFITLSATSPATTLGGNWVEIEGGRFLMSCTSGGTVYKKTSDTSAQTAATLTGTAGQTGGYSLNGMILKSSSYYGTRVGSDTSYLVKNDKGIEAGTTVVNENVGKDNDNANVALNTTSSGSHLVAPYQLYSTVTLNNYPPYLTVHIWKRTA